MKTRIAHLSDPHFGTEVPEVALALQSILTKLDPDVVVVSGDITQRARRAQFLAAKAFFTKLKSAALIVVPGNHDIPLFNLPERLLAPHKNFLKYFNPGLEDRRLVNNVDLSAFNSTTRWRHIQGQLNAQRIRETYSSGSASPSAFKVAIIHHPLDVHSSVDEKNLLNGRKEVILELANQQVDLIVGGHIHEPFICLSDQRYPDLPRAMLISVAGTCLSRRTRAHVPNSFNLIECAMENDLAHLSITRLDYQREKKSFVVIKTLHFVRNQDAGWKATS